MLPLLIFVCFFLAADNILAIIGATNSKSAVESRLQLIDNYCNVRELAI